MTRALVIAASIAAAIALLWGAFWLHTQRVASLAEQVGTLTTERDDARAAAEAQLGELRAAERARDVETSRCVARLDAAEFRCLARIEEAVEEAAEIRRIVYACPAFDEDRCPVRELLGADQLRRAAGDLP